MTDFTLRDDKETCSLRGRSRSRGTGWTAAAHSCPALAVFPSSSASVAPSCDPALGGSGCSCAEDVINHMLSQRLPVVEK